MRKDDNYVLGKEEREVWMLERKNRGMEDSHG